MRTKFDAFKIEMQLNKGFGSIVSKFVVETVQYRRGGRAEKFRGGTLPLEGHANKKVLPLSRQEIVSSNGFYSDISNQHQMKQYKSCLKSFL